jgi:hypothetical protein
MAFNDRPVITVNFETAISLGPDEVVKGPVKQKGMGNYTLCEKCNNITGHWYGTRFVAWCYQGMEILRRAQGKPSLFYMNYLFPLAIIKQIITMFFSVNGEKFNEMNPDLVEFVLNRDRKYLSPKYRLFVYYNIEGKLRTSGVSALWAGNKGKMSVISELTFPSFGYVMSFDSEPPDSRLFEISHFARYDYNAFEVMELRLPVLPTHMMFPGDYRSKEEIFQQEVENQRSWNEYNKIQPSFH